MTRTRLGGVVRTVDGIDTDERKASMGSLSAAPS